MPIPLETAQKHHPVELTRQASPESPLLQGDFTLDELKQQFGTSDMTEDAVLAAAGNLGHAFFKIGTIYRSFAPVKGETAILSPSQESGIEIAPTSIDLEKVSGLIGVQNSDKDAEEEDGDDWGIVDDPDIDDLESDGEEEGLEF